MKHRYFPRYNDDADFTTNAPSYYQDLARKQKLIEMLAKKIWEYEETLDLTLEEISNRLESYIQENDNLMTERLEQWDLNLEKFPENVELLLQEWLSDGTLDHIINETIFNWKADKTYVDSEIERLDLKDENLTTQLQKKVSKEDLHVNVKDFGAVGDGVADDTQAIQEAIDFVRDRITQYNLTGGWYAGGGIVFFPTGRYKVTSTLRVKRSTTLMGETQFSTIIDGYTLTGTGADSWALTNITESGEYQHSVSLKNLTFLGTGVSFLRNYNSFIEDCAFFNIRSENDSKIALLLQLTVGQYFNRIQFMNCNKGIVINGNAGVGPSTTAYFKHLWVTNCGVGIECDFGTNELHTSSIKDSIFEYCGTGIRLNGNLKLTIEDMHFEQNTTYDIHGTIRENSVITIRNTQSDLSNIFFGSRGAPQTERFKLVLAHIRGRGDSGLLIQNGCQVDVHEETPDIDYLILPTSVRRYSPNNEMYATAPPSSDTLITYKRGDRIINTTPAAGGYMGWVCVAESGTAGIWKGYGLIAE